MLQFICIPLCILCCSLFEVPMSFEAEGAGRRIVQYILKFGASGDKRQTHEHHPRVDDSASHRDQNYIFIKIEEYIIKKFESFEIKNQ